MRKLLFNIFLISFFYICNGFIFNTLTMKMNQQLNMARLNDSSKQRVIVQPVDNFNSKDNRTWEMHYYENLDCWKEGGPIFISLRGEGIIRHLNTAVELALETSGALIAPEHRYYGIIPPLDDSSVSNLKYLSSEQAIADVANLVKKLKSLPQFQSSKVVAIGGSYAGNLAAWLRKLHPNIIDAAVSSSAPVLAIKDFYEYLEVVNADFDVLGGTCLKKIKVIFERYNELFKSAEGIEKLKQEENICLETDMTKIENKQYFFSWQMEIFLLAAQYSNTRDIEHLCVSLDTSQAGSTKNGEGPLWNIKKLCNDVDYYKNLDNIRFQRYGWYYAYQTCTEFGWFLTTSSKHQPFTNNMPLDLSIKGCTYLFGPYFNEFRVDEGIKTTNKLYGGLEPNVTNVVFINSGLDPWHKLGILKSLSDEAPAIFIPHESKCSDLRKPEEGDTDELIKARLSVKEIIKKWIGASS